MYIVASIIWVIDAGREVSWLGAFFWVFFDAAVAFGDFLRANIKEKYETSENCAELCEYHLIL